MKYLNPIPLLILFASCQFTAFKEKFSATLADSIKTDQLLPATFVFSSQVIQYKGDYYHWDNKINQVVCLDSTFKFKEHFGNIGSTPESISFYSSFSIVDDYLFICGNQCLVYRLDTPKFLGKFAFEIGEVEWILKFADKLVLGGPSESDDSYSLYATQFDLVTGFSPLQNVAKIRFDAKLDYVCKSTTALVCQDRLVLLKKDVGELEIMNKNFVLERSFRLPYSSREEENRDFIDEETYVVKNIEAWSMTKCAKFIFINRTEDLNTGVERNKFKRVHCFDLQMEYAGTFLLKKGAIFISCNCANQLLANKMDHETLYLYELL